MAMGVSDAGMLIQTMIEPDKAEWTGQMMPIPAACVRSASKFDRDSESITADPLGQRIWIGLEHHNLICSAIPGGSSRVVAPKAMQEWPRTGGPEAIVRLKDGRILVIAERSYPPAPSVPILLFDRDPSDPAAQMTQTRYLPPSGYAPVDASQLPDGRLLVLHRRFELPFAFSAILSIGSLETSGRTPVLQTRPILWLNAGRGADNWEAIGVEDRGQGRATIWIANDNNFMIGEPNYLLRLEWGASSQPQ